MLKIARAIDSPGGRDPTFERIIQVSTTAQMIPHWIMPVACRRVISIPSVRPRTFGDIRGDIRGLGISGDIRGQVLNYKVIARRTIHQPYNSRPDPLAP